MEKLMLRYDFTEVNSTIIGDVSGNGMAGVVRNYDAGGMEFAEEDIFGKKERIIRLPGGKNGGYIELPSGILQNNEGLTITFWCRINGQKEGCALFAFGEDKALYMETVSKEDGLAMADGMAQFMAEMPECYSEAAEDGVVLIPSLTSGGSSQAWGTANRRVLQKGRWYMIAVTLDKEPESHLKYYVDAELAGHMRQRRMAANMLYGARQAFFGKGLEDSEPICADFADIRIYHTVKTAEEIAAMFDIGDGARIEADWKRIRLPEVVEEDFALPEAGAYGSTIRWSSARPDLITEQGRVVRPAPGSGDAAVTLSAELRCGEAVRTYTDTVTVRALPTAREIVEHDGALLRALADDHAYRNIVLPRTGDWGSAITYTSDCPRLLEDDGTLHRPAPGEEPRSVTLTATLRREEAELVVPLPFTVLPLRASKTVRSVETVSVRTLQGILPQLPARVRVTYTDGACETQYVQWKPIAPQALEKQGTCTAEGTLENGETLTGRVTVLSRDAKPAERGHRFTLRSTRLTGRNILTENYRRGLDYLLYIDADRMLYNFRLTFGQDVKGAKPLGGWDEPTGLLRGHSTGHFLSGLAYAYAQSGDARIRDKLNYMVSELHALQKLSKGRPEDFTTVCTPDNAAQQLWSRDPSTWGEGYIGAYSPDQFALLEQYTPYATIWAPYYTLHKILAGLLDCYLYAENEEALEVASGIGDWVYHRLSVLSKEQLAKMWAMYIAGEYGGMNESLSTLYLITGKKEYSDTAALFDNPKVFDGLSAGRDSISGIHANQHIPQIIGALQEYRATGDNRYFAIARNFWKIVTAHYAYAIGGVGRGENFKEPDILAGNIEGARNCETCCAYNLLKLTKELYRYDPDNPEYMDYYERTMLNQVAASQSPVVTPTRHNGVTYMLPIGPGARRHYSNDYNDFSCCNGTGMENHVKYQENVYYETDEAVYVNLYVPSDLTLEHGRLLLEGSFPSERMTLLAEGEDAAVKLRVPYWCRDTFRVTVHGETLRPDPDAAYLGLTLAAGEKADIELPYSLHLDYTMDSLDGDRVAALMYGPLVMTALSDSEDWLRLVFGESLEKELAVRWADGQPELAYKAIRFVPMYKAHDVRYHAYIKVIQP